MLIQLTVMDDTHVVPLADLTFHVCFPRERGSVEIWGNTDGFGDALYLDNIF